MKLSPLAVELNDVIRSEAPAVLDMLSALGKRFYFPKGIISQSAEAKARAKRHNATIGIALEQGKPMHLPCLQKHFTELGPADLYTYAPPAGKAELRAAWREKQLEENPRLREKRLGAPIVTSALTHGLSLVAELFADPGDALLLPDQLWGNYRLTFEVRHGAVIHTFPFFAGEGIDLDAFAAAVERLGGEGRKLIVLLNFPNNPTGYTPTPAEAESMASTLGRAAEAGTRVVAVCDDAYFNLVYDDRCLRESILGHLAGLHENLLAIRLDGATKEQFVWGFRVGFLTYAAAGRGDVARVHEALEKKTAGAIRAGVSNAPHISQSLVLRALRDPAFRGEQAEKREILGARAARAREVLADPRFAEAWEPYPFNSGYFMCLRLKTVEAEPLRIHLLDRHGIGVIATARHDVRVAFSCLELDEIAEVYEGIYQGIRELA
jgi:aspartate/methionine/tyrosine aminotransferase